MHYCWNGDKNFAGAGVVPGGPPSFGLVFHVVVASAAAARQPCGAPISCKEASANGAGAVRVRAASGHN